MLQETIEQGVDLETARCRRGSILPPRTGSA